MKKRFLAVCLALALCMGLFPVSAQAAETPALTGEEMLALLPSEPPEFFVPESISLPYDEAEEEATFQQIVELTERLTGGTKTETEKAYAIFEWVSTNISYDHTGSQYVDIYSQGGALTEEQAVRMRQVSNPGYAFRNRRAICTGYALLSQLMLRLAGLPSAYVENVESDPGHAWNVVYADGRWIQLDTTLRGWDDACDSNPVITRIVFPDRIFLITISRTGQISCSLQSQYDDLASVTIPDYVNALGHSAFIDCTNLTSVDIPDNVIFIGDSAFKGCDGLTSVTIPDSVTEIGAHVFSGCTALTRVDFPDSVTEIGMWVFQGCTGLTSVTLPDGMTEIGQYMFSGCTALTSVDIPDSVTSIGSSAFKDCIALTSIDIPANVTSITSGAFENCTALTRATIRDGVTGIEARVFSGCTSLTSVAIPASVTSIGQAAFYQCPNLTDVYYSGSEKQWDAIKIGMFNGLSSGSLPRKTIHYNTVGGFGDVNTGAYYADAVQWAVANGITTGKTDAAFAPGLKCSHGEILTFLWRAAGEPESSAQPPIAMNGDEFYYKAAKWAAEKGMIGGDFDPKASCTRADAVRYIWQAFGGPAASYDGRFTDVPAGSPHATAVAWAVEKGVTTGTTGTTFSPDKICSRGDIVTFLYRAYE